MTDETKNKQTAANDKASSSKFNIILFIAIFVIAAIGFIASQKSTFDAAFVKAKLNEWAAIQQAENPRSNWKFGDVKVKSTDADREVIIHDYEFTYIVEAAEDDDEKDEVMRVSIAKVLIKPHDDKMKNFKMIADAPIIVTEEHGTSVLTFEPRLAVDVSQSNEKFSYDIPLAAMVTVESEKHAVPTIVKMGDGSHVSGSYELSQNNKGNIALTISSLKAYAQNKPEHSVTADSLQLDGKWHSEIEAHGAMSITLALKNLFTDEETMPYGPVSLMLDGDYSGPMPEDDDTPIDWSKEKALVDLRDLSIMTDEVTLNAKLNFQTGRGELLPVGEGQLKISNLPFVLDELRKNKVLDGQAEKLISVMVQLITGEELDSITKLEIPVKRADGGSLTIGKSTFEELFAVFLTGGNINPAAVTDNAAPAPAANDTAPVEVIDDDEVKELFND